jgi:hypothetical protein
MHQKIIWFFAVIPAEAGIQMYLNFLDSGSRYPGLDPGARNDVPFLLRTLFTEP